MREFEVKTGVKVDCMLVDYLDLMMPAQRKVPPSDLYIKDKFVSEELRNFAVEHDLLFATASQLNRSAVEEIEFDHSHISGGISKIQTADNVIGIFTSQAMRERGRYQIQFMKTRSSAGVGSKVDLAFDIAGLRITDLEEQESESDMINSSYNDKLDSLRRQSTVSKSAGVQAAEIVQTHTLSQEKFRNILKKQD
jgi:hypothetical protein